MEAYVVLISGRVQGVGFRWFTEKEAQACDVCGYVRNLPDGRVEVFAQGDESTLPSFCERLRVGPRAAHIEDFDMTPVSVDSELTSFTVRF